MRVIGAILMIVVGTAIGFGKASSLRQQQTQMSLYLDLLQYLQSNLQYRRASTKELLRSAATLPNLQGCKPLMLVVQGWEDHLPFSISWSQAIQQSAMPFTTNQQQLLGRMGRILGRGTASEQQQALSYLQQGVQTEYQQLQAKVQKDGNLYQTLGVFGGLFGAILIL